MHFESVNRQHGFKELMQFLAKHMGKTVSIALLIGYLITQNSDVNLLLGFDKVAADGWELLINVAYHWLFSISFGVLIWMSLSQAIDQILERAERFLNVVAYPAFSNLLNKYVPTRALEPMLRPPRFAS